MLPLVCIDVDGTLVGSKGEPTDAVWAAAEQAVGRGQALALCTARGAFGPTWEWAKRLDPNGWHVFHAGGAIVHAATGEVREHPLPQDVVDITRALAADNGWVYEEYSAQDYVVAEDSELASGHARLLGMPMNARPLDELDGAVVRVQFIVDVADRDQILQVEVPGAEMSHATSPAQPGAAYISYVPVGITKATAIEEIAGILGTTIDTVMMVGDGHNDMEPMAATGFGAAMGNAVDEVKALASHVVADVEHDGLVEALALSVELG